VLFRSGSTVLTLSDLSRVFSMASVDESDVGQVKLGQEAAISADAFPGKKFKGQVVQIATRGANVSNVVTFPVKIEVLDHKKALLKPEMTTNVQIIVAQKEDALQVPSEALTRKQGPQRVVQVLKADGGSEERPVEAGISDGSNTEIVTGLREGETVTYKKGESDSRYRANQQNRPPPMMLGGMGGRR
jgi:HlyD family secretion protein